MVLGPLVRRGVEIASEHLARDEDDTPDLEVSGWLIGLFSITAIGLMVSVWAVEYTYGSVVAALAAVEETNPEIYVRIEPDFDPNKPIDPNEPENATVPPKPITSSLRSAVKHLRARGGRWSKFRGVSMFIIYFFARAFLTAIIPISMDNFFGQFFAQMLAGLLLANLQLAWVHIVISEPSPKYFWQRIPGYKSWIKFAPVVAFEHFATGAAFYFPLAITASVGGGLELFNHPGAVPTGKAACQTLALLVLPSLLGFAVSVPVRAISIRVAASMLPEEDDTIVPFDRSFGGKVAPAILGTGDKLGIVDAWKTFDRGARMRFVKTLLKVFAIEAGLFLFFSMAMGAELFFLGYSTFERFASSSSL